MPLPYRHNKVQRVLDSINRNGFIFDKEWIEILCDIGVIVHKEYGYPILRPYFNYDRQKIRVHRMIVLCPDGLYVDHINRIREDNRASNLRVIHPKDNRLNLSKYKQYRY